MRIELCPMLRDPVLLAEAMQLRLLDNGDSFGEAVRINGIATDSREVEQGDLFVALQGKSRDGADYAFDALSRGAVGVLSSACDVGGSEHFLRFTAQDCVAALARAARFYRKQSKAFVIAVGGSTGKTTTKEALSAVLREAGSVSCTAGNYNSTIGLPLSLLSFDESSRYWVCELGINHVGEMEALSQTACPDLAVLTNVGTAHVGNFGDFPTLLSQKAQLASGLTEGGILLASAELPIGIFPCPRQSVRRVGNTEKADFYMENVVMSQNGIVGDLICPDRVITNLAWSVPGRIGLSTLSTVSAAAVLAGCTDSMIRTGLEKAARQTPRLRTFSMGSRLVIDDTYNASPESVAGAFEVFSYRAPNRMRVAVLGDMLELGVHSAMLHQAVGEAVVQSGISMLFTYGSEALHIAESARACGMPADVIFSFGQEQARDLAQAICRYVPQTAALLFKASGRMRLWRIIEMIDRGEEFSSANRN